MAIADSNIKSRLVDLGTKLKRSAPTLDTCMQKSDNIKNENVSAAAKVRAAAENYRHIHMLSREEPRQTNNRSLRNPPCIELMKKGLSVDKERTDRPCIVPTKGTQFGLKPFKAPKNFSTIFKNCAASAAELV
jgi:hypothetical protein